MFIDFNYNHNYLPLNNEVIFEKYSNSLYKFIKYFNISVLVFIDLKKKSFFLKKFLKYKLINISLNCSFNSKDMDLFIDSQHSETINYLIYLLVINIYLSKKN